MCVFMTTRYNLRLDIPRTESIYSIMRPHYMRFAQFMTGINMKSLLFPSMLLCLVTITVTKAVGDTTSSTAALPASSAEPSTPSCGFPGDADSYGLGVRLGAYIQWVTSVIAYNIYDSESASMRGVNTCFQAAVFIGLVIVTAQRTELYAVEAFILLLFCVGGFCCALPRPYRGHSELQGLARFRPSSIGDLVRSILGAATCAYGVWFIFDGADRMINTECNSPIFVFARVSLYGWARTLLKVFLVLWLALMTVFLLLNTSAVLKDCSDYIRNWTNVQELDSPTSDDVMQPSWKIICLSFIGLALLVVAIELTLYWNEVEDVYSLGSTGQVFPLVVGTAGLSRLLWKCGQDYIKGDIQWNPRA